MNFANGKQTVGNAAMLIAAAYLLSRLLGLFRDRLLVTHFTKGPLLDSYYAAFRLPEMLFTLLVSGAFAVAFIPILSEHLDKNKREEAWEVTSTLLNFLVLATVVGAVLIAIFADPLITLITPGFDHERHTITVQLTRIMLITPIFFAISSVLGSVQQVFGRFLIFALSSVLYNVGIILGIAFFANRYSVQGVAWGVVLGTLLQAMLQIAGMSGLGYKWRFTMNLRLPAVRQTLALMIPRSLDAGIDQINYSVETLIGSGLSSGSLVAFNLANNLKNVPLVLIANSIATAAFPRLAASAANGERAKLIEEYVRTARFILFLAIPAAIFAFIARGYIVRLLYSFGDADTANTLGWFAGTIIFASLFQLVSRVHFAMQDTKTPLYVSLASIPINILLSFILAARFGVVGLAMAASIVAMLETFTLLTLLRRKMGSFGEREVLQGAWRMALAGLIMLGVLYVTVSRFLPLYADDKGFIVLLPKFSVLLFVGIAAYLIPCQLLKLAEANVFVGRVRDIMVRSINLT